MPNYHEWKPGAAGGTPLNVDRLNEPFHIKSVVYDAVNDRLVWTIGLGRTWFGAILVEHAAATMYYTNAPAINTTYYVYLTVAGVVINTTAQPAAGQIPIGGVTVGAAKGTLTKFDRRPGLDGAGAQALSEKVGKGTGNQSVEEVLAFLLPVDTRSWVATAWNADQKPTTIQVKDGVTVVATITIVYNANNRPTSMSVTAGGKTVTYTVTWTGDRFDSITKVVV